MPHVIVHFDPKQVNQEIIDELKQVLQIATVIAMCSAEVLPDDYDEKAFRGIQIFPKDVYVRQQASHETDVNPAPVEIVVEAGRRKGRDPKIVSRIIEARIRREKLIPEHLLGEGQSCIWVKFCEENDFRFIRK